MLYYINTYNSMQGRVIKFSFKTKINIILIGMFVDFAFSFAGSYIFINHSGMCSGSNNG